MESGEDDPSDVQNRSPVRDTLDEVERSQRLTKNDLCQSDGHQRHTCGNRTARQEPEESPCEAKRRARCQRDTVKVLVHGKPCNLPKPDHVPRDQLTKEKYLDFLAQPKKKCDIKCDRKEVIRKIRPTTVRIEELAKPPERRVRNTLLQKGEVLPPEMIDKLISLIEEQTAFTPEQAEKYLHYKECTSRLKSKKSKRRSPKNDDLDCCQPASFSYGEPMDLEAANAQYSMARRFVKAIINSSTEPKLPREEYGDISEVILCRMAEDLNYDPAGCEDRTSQQMRLLADLLAAWVSGILIEVSDNQREKLLEECERRRREIRELDDRDWFGEPEEDECEEDPEPQDDFQDDEDLDCDLIETEDFGVQVDTIEPCGAGPDLEGDEEDLDELSEGGSEDSAVMEDPGDLGPESRTDAGTGEQLVEGFDEEQQTECQVEEVACMTEEPCGEEGLPVCDKDPRKKCNAFESDLPFVTFAKLIETLYCMIECEAENAMRCPIDNRIHRVVYEKLEELIMREDPSLLDERLRDMLNITAGKLAIWLRKTLGEREIGFLEKHPAEVESCEVRRWADWSVEVADLGLHWTRWLGEKIQESQRLKVRPCVTRGEWKDFTKDYEEKAMLWRRTYLEAQHQGHHNRMMIPERKVLKSGTKVFPKWSRETIERVTNFCPCNGSQSGTDPCADQQRRSRAR